MTQDNGATPDLHAVNDAEPVRRRADSTERAYTAIRGMAVGFQLRPNERINEVQLARELSLSRSPVREALNRLATEGFLSFVPNRGFFFHSPDIAELVQIYETRAVVEKGAYALACIRATQAQWEALGRFWADALVEYASRDADRILALDEEFHLRLASLSTNQELVRLLAAINARIRFVRRIQIDRGRRHDSMIGDHDALLATLRRRDVVRGQEILAAHISMSIENATDVLKEAVFNVVVRSAAPAA